MQEVEQIVCDEALRTKLRLELSSVYGEMIGGDRLRHVLGFSSSSALSMAISRKTIGLVLFKVQGRRGRFALTTDVVDWLISRKASASHQRTQPQPIQFQKNRQTEGETM